MFLRAKLISCVHLSVSNYYSRYERCILNIPESCQAYSDSLLSVCINCSLDTGSVLGP